MRMAESIAKIASELHVPYIYKASYDKANDLLFLPIAGRESQKAFACSRTIKDQFKLPILTDVHDVAQVALAAEVAEVLQVPAFLSRQTDLLIAVGRSGRVVNLKKGQFLSPWEMANAVEKVASTGNKNIFITERGTSFGYQNLVVDMRTFPILRKTRLSRGF